MRVVKQVLGKQMQFGGKEHSGWLPPNAAHPRPTPVRNAVIDVRIIDDGYGFLLDCESRNTEDSWDNWYERLEDAEEEAESKLGIEAGEWQVPDE
jgi:hypothetical protein